MKLKFQNRLILLFLLALSNIVLAQQKEISVTGMVIESEGNNPVEFATIIIKDKNTYKNITGSTTGSDGRFRVQTDSSSFFVEVSFIGYEAVQVKDLNLVNNRIDLGTISLSENNQKINEVTVRAEKSQTEFKLDKRVFNVGKDISSTGMSALEVLDNVPSVNVNIEGRISLRGSYGVQILVNGKPSVIVGENTLGTITAEMIEKVEVITNPSAKYDAEGTSGIINIVMKKEERKGLNGALSLNAGIPTNHSAGLSLNRRTEKFNLFSQFGIGLKTNPRDKISINSDLINNTSVISEGSEHRDESYYNVVLGTDYHINKLNILTLSGNLAYEIEEQPSHVDYHIYKDGKEESHWYRDEVTDAINPRWQYELQYQKDFEDHKDHQFLFSALGNFWGKDQSSEFTNTVVYGEIEQVDQLTETDFQEAKYTFKMDYTKPFNEEITMEAGGQYVMQDVRNDYEVQNREDNEWVPVVGLTNVFEYDQKVLGLYGTAAYEGDKWGVKLGLRMEQTNLNTLLINTNEANSQNYANLFPTLHSSLKLSGQFSLQAGYSRRIYRPRLFDLNPFFNIRNSYVIRKGNPDLKPEFTDSYEFTSIYIVSKASLNVGVYYRYTTDAIERVSIYEDNVNTITPMNIGTNHVKGFEFNGKYTPIKWLTFNGDFNYSFLNRQGEFEDYSFDMESDQWSSKLVTKMKLPAQFEVELTGNYQSRRKSIQWEYGDNLYASLGLRKKLFKGKTVISCSINDVFESRESEGEAFGPDYYLYSATKARRFISFGLSYGFGDGEAMEYGGKTRF